MKILPIDSTSLARIIFFPRTALFCAALVLVPALAAALDFSVTQAQADWMPDATNLRWNDGRLESQFFVLVQSDQKQDKLSVVISGAGPDRTEPIADVRPVSDQQAEALIAGDSWFSVKADVFAQKFASTRSLTKLWLPVESGRPIRFELRQGATKVSDQTITPEVAGPVWFRTGWKAPAEDPLLHDRVLFPHNSLMVQGGRPVSLAFDLVGSGPAAAVAATLVTSVREEAAEGTLWQQRDALSVKRQTLSTATVALPSAGWAPGSYVITAELQDAAGKFIGIVKRGLVVVAPKPTASRFGATYANLTTPASVYAKAEEEPPIFKTAREYGATHQGPDSDVVVSFDGKPDHLVFSHLNRGYTPFWFVNELGIDWEWVEGHDNELGSLEVQYDPECRYARVSVVASTPARAIVHWRYNTSSRYYDRYFDEWVDEFYFVYPDQTAVRKIMGYFRRHNWHETFEPYLVGPAGLHLGEVFEDKHISLLNLSGGKIDLDPINLWKDWNEQWSILRAADPRQTAIMRFNLRGGRKFFYSFADLRRVYSLWSQLDWDGKNLKEIPGGREQPFPQDMDKPTAKLLQSQISSYCLFDAQAALLEARSLPDGQKFTPEQLERETNNKMSQFKDMADVRIVSTYAYLLGLGDQVDPVAMTQAWVAPAGVEQVAGAGFDGFETTERAYRFSRQADATTISFRFVPQAGKPQVNPVFVVDGLTSTASLQLTLNGQKLAAAAYRVGFEAQSSGQFRAVIWIGQVLSGAVDVRIEQP